MQQSDKLLNRKSEQEKCRHTYLQKVEKSTYYIEEGWGQFPLLESPKIKEECQVGNTVCKLICLHCDKVLDKWEKVNEQT